MKKLLCTLLFLCSSYAFSLAQSPYKPDCYAEVVPELNKLYEGDSCLVSIVLYANFPFHRIKSKLLPLQIQGGKARLVGKNEQHQERVHTPKGEFYRLVLQQYVVGKDTKGVISFPKQRYKVELGIYERVSDPFSFFFGQQSRLVRTLSATVHLSPFSLSVVPRPKRTTNDMLRAGETVL